MKDHDWMDHFTLPRSPAQAEAVLERTALVCYFLGALEAVLGLLGFEGLFSGLSHICLGYGIGRHRSRAAAAALLLEAAGSVIVALLGGGPAAAGDLALAVPSLLVAVFAVPAVRAALAWHELTGTVVHPGHVAKKGFAAFCYTGFVYALVSVAALLVAPESAAGSPRALAVAASVPVFLTLTAALAGRLPFTKDLPFASPR